jgi:hypothetical protein
MPLRRRSSQNASQPISGLRGNWHRRRVFAAIRSSLHRVSIAAEQSFVAWHAALPSCWTLIPAVTVTTGRLATRGGKDAAGILTAHPPADTRCQLSCMPLIPR